MAIAASSAPQIAGPGGSCDIPVYMQSKVVVAGHQKCGEPECTDSTPLKLYLHYDYTSDADIDDAAGGIHVDTTLSVTYDPLTCLFTTCDETGTASCLNCVPPCQTVHVSGCSRNQDEQWSDEACKAWCFDAVAYHRQSAEQTLFECTPEHTHVVDEWEDSLMTYRLEEEWTRSGEYTDELLREIIIGKMPAFGQEWAEAPDVAYYDLWNSHVDGQGQRLQYRLRFWGAKDQSYRLDWKEVTAHADGTSTSVPRYEHLVGVGGWTFTGEHQIEPPLWNGYPEDGVAVTFVSDIEAKPWTPSAAEPGTGVIGVVGAEGECGGGGCGGSRVEDYGVFVALGLGRAAAGASAGELEFSAELPSLALATPASLQVTANRSDVEVVSVDGVLRQVKVPQALADVATNSAFQYEIRFYSLSDVGGFEDGTYQLLNPTNWFVQWTIENPAASAEIFNQLRVTETRGASAKVHEFTYDAGSGSWTVTRPGQVREDQISKTVDVENGTHTEVATVRAPGGGAVARRSQTWCLFTWDGVSQEVLVAETFGEGGSARTTRWDYYETSPFTVQGSVVPLKCVIHPSGYWERIDEYDAIGRPLVVVHQFLNAPTNALASEARRFGYDYTPLSGTQDDGTLEPDLPRRTDESLLGVPISTAYTIVEPYQTRTIRCLRPGLDWDDPSNLVTTNKYYDSWAGQFEHRLRSVQHPDGRREAYLYAAAGSGANATLTTVALLGEPVSGNDTNIASGTITTTVQGDVGQVLSVSVVDKASGIVVDQKAYTYTDLFKRSHAVVDLSGRTNTVQYACCGLELVTDHDGAQTQYLYDGLGRGIGSCVLSYNPVLTTTNVLDAAGRVLATVHSGGGTAIVQRQSAYDLAGEVVSETNALGGTTTYAETKVNGQTVRTTTYPDTSTRIETSAQDGSLVEVGGTAASPLRYLYGVDDTGEEDAQSNPILLPFTFEIRVWETGATNEWTKRYADSLGRAYKTVYAAASGAPTQRTLYNGKGQIERQIDPDGVLTLFQYNARGESEYTALNAGGTTNIDFAGLDRITRTVSDVCNNGVANVRRTRTYAWHVLNTDTSILISSSEVSVDGLRSWQRIYADGVNAVTTQSQTAYGSSGSRTVTLTNPDGSSTVNAYAYGRLVSTTRKDSGGSQVTQTSYADAVLDEVPGWRERISLLRVSILQPSHGEVDQ